MKLVLIISVLIFLSKFTNAQNEKLIVNDSADKIITYVPFKYKDLSEYYLDEDETLKPSSFYGSWTITDIANTGGTFVNEREIRSQLGNKLIISEDKISFNFIGYTYEVNDPNISFEDIDPEDIVSIKGTAYFFGYMDQRKKIFMMRIDGVGYFEIINYAEIAIYYDGRIYFLQKDEK